MCRLWAQLSRIICFRHRICINLEPQLWRKWRRCSWALSLASTLLTLLYTASICIVWPEDIPGSSHGPEVLGINPQAPIAFTLWLRGDGLQRPAPQSSILKRIGWDLCDVQCTPCHGSPRLTSASLKGFRRPSQVSYFQLSLFLFASRWRHWQFSIWALASSLLEPYLDWNP